MTAARVLADVNRGATVITSTSASVTPITIKAASGQTADLLQFKNSSDVIVGEIDKNGILTTPGSVVQVQTVALTFKFFN
jgi:soluble cytochrome b562